MNLVSDERLVLEGRAVAQTVSHRLLNHYARFSSQFLVGRGQFIFVLFDFPPAGYYSISLAYLFVCCQVDAQRAD